MKTRSNMPLFVVETTNIKALSNSQIDLLRCGDYLVKKTGNMQHAYKVTYKEDKHGICLTYFDAGYTETVSYDYTNGNWVYNSTDVVTTNKLEQITDANEHKRFVEGNIEIETITGVTQTYGKWSLSGTHLMFVVCIELANSAVITSSKLCKINLPDWVMNKIVPIYGNTINPYTTFTGGVITGGTGSGNQNISCSLTKETDHIAINLYSITSTGDRGYRVQFDLLIDND